ncbi:NADH dehydrogenase [ubiquinone] flavoprotein 2, mitochondrial isoform X2 [Macaca mulatta]
MREPHSYKSRRALRYPGAQGAAPGHFLSRPGPLRQPVGHRPFRARAGPRPSPGKSPPTGPQQPPRALAPSRRPPPLGVGSGVPPGTPRPGVGNAHAVRPGLARDSRLARPGKGEQCGPPCSSPRRSGPGRLASPPTGAESRPALARSVSKTPAPKEAPRISSLVTWMLLGCSILESSGLFREGLRRTSLGLEKGDQCLIYCSCALHIGNAGNGHSWGESAESGMLNSITESSCSFRVSMRSSSISACLTVRGKPSRRKPFLHKGVSKFFSVSSTTISSLTSFPPSIVAFSFIPSSEPEAAMALSMSPVAIWQTQKFSANLGAWVPLQARGGPSSTARMPLGYSGSAAGTLGAMSTEVSHSPLEILKLDFVISQCISIVTQRTLKKLM